MIINTLESQLEQIKINIINLDLIDDFEQRLDNLEKINNMIIQFANEINSLPIEQFVEYNRKLNFIMPLLEHVMDNLIADKQKLAMQIENIDLAKKAFKAYEEANEEA